MQYRTVRCVRVCECIEEKSCAVPDSAMLVHVGSIVLCIAMLLNSAHSTSKDLSSDQVLLLHNF